MFWFNVECLIQVGNDAFIFSSKDLKEELHKALETPGPCLIDCQIIKDENCYPMIPSGAAHNEMLFNDDGISMEVGDEGKVLI